MEKMIEGTKGSLDWLVSEGHIYLLTLYGKGVKDDLTPAERAAWRKVVEEIANG